MSTIKVMAVEGRVVRESPRGPMIPSDRYVSVENTRYIQRLIHVHGDLLAEPDKVKPVPASTPVDKKDTK